ncbi:PREDICTED: ATP synthase subunit epsilon, mitochondrial [Mesitornis unicolor]|uniref:ATP synthase subunit epsilon, mitochondrial n=1 Tax=Mesitornis unicolor TaxID=54374 RepID=UPI00052802D9|nr:PREDICTED: ATP synthase subunit epsilon, mitochondrial [Mesitornis unicolor]
MVADWSRLLSRVPASSRGFFAIAVTAGREGLAGRASGVAAVPLEGYIRYSQICAQAVRAAMKPQYKAEAERVAVATVKTVKPKKE